MKIERALSIRQPYVEEIFRGLKTVEYRSIPTNVRGTVYIYASLSPGDPARFARLKVKPGDLRTGFILGTVEIVGCSYRNGGYEWKLANARRLKRPFAPAKKPQPVWFRPF